MTWPDRIAAARRAAGLVRVVHPPVGRPVVVWAPAEGHVVRGYEVPDSYVAADSEHVWWGRPVRLDEQGSAAPVVHVVFGDRP